MGVVPASLDNQMSNIAQEEKEIIRFTIQKENSGIDKRELTSI